MRRNRRSRSHHASYLAGARSLCSPSAPSQLEHLMATRPDLRTNHGGREWAACPVNRNLRAVSATISEPRSSGQPRRGRPPRGAALADELRCTTPSPQGKSNAPRLYMRDGGRLSPHATSPWSRCLDVMRRIGVSLIFVLVLSAVAAFSAVASAETFSRPVRLPSAPSLVWDFAVNDRGQAVAVEGNAHGASVYPIGRRGHLGKPWQVKVPGGFPGDETSVTLDSRGSIAVGILYQDDTAEPSHEYPGCCLRVAVASWKLGSKPPTAQSLSPPQDAASGDPHQALQAPLLAIGPSA